MNEAESIPAPPEDGAAPLAAVAEVPAAPGGEAQGGGGVAVSG